MIHDDSDIVKDNFTFKSEDLEMINDVIDADFIVNVENDDDIWKYKDINETDFIRVTYWDHMTLLSGEPWF